MAAVSQKTQAPKNALAAAAAKKSALAAAAPQAPVAVEDELDGFDEPEEKKETAPEPVVESEPEVKTRKDYEKDKKEGKKGGRKTESAPIVLMDDFIRTKNGEIRKDEDKDDMRYSPGFHPNVGFVNENGVRFPVGWKFKGGFIGTFGTVVLNHCPKCHSRQGIDAARSGKCENEKAGPDKTRCGFDQVRELEEIDTDQIE